MKIKEIFYSIQGEGRNTGRPAVFCRFAGCNLWSGLEQDRLSAKCTFCDTDFRGGFTLEEDELVEKIAYMWGSTGDLDDCATQKVATSGRPFVVFTGGEPGLQLTPSLLHKMRLIGFDVAVETNGTILLPEGVYWITVSPKQGNEIVQTKGKELKLAWPQDYDLDELRKNDFEYFYLQPIDGVANSVDITVATILANPGWRLSLQTHKTTGLR